MRMFTLVTVPLVLAAAPAAAPDDPAAVVDRETTAYTFVSPS
jgi:hypothetical protein